MLAEKKSVSWAEGPGAKGDQRQSEAAAAAALILVQLAAVQATGQVSGVHMDAIRTIVAALPPERVRQLTATPRGDAGVSALPYTPQLRTYALAEADRIESAAIILAQQQNLPNRLREAVLARPDLVHPVQAEAVLAILAEACKVSSRAIQDIMSEVGPSGTPRAPFWTRIATAVGRLMPVTGDNMKEDPTDLADASMGTGPQGIKGSRSMGGEEAGGSGSGRSDKKRRQAPTAPPPPPGPAACSPTKGGAVATAAPDAALGGAAMPPVANSPSPAEIERLQAAASEAVEAQRVALLVAEVQGISNDMRAKAEALVTIGHLTLAQLEPVLAKLESVRRDRPGYEKELLTKLRRPSPNPPALVPGGWTAFHSLVLNTAKRIRVAAAAAAPAAGPSPSGSVSESASFFASALAGGSSLEGGAAPGPDDADSAPPRALALRASPPSESAPGGGSEAMDMLLTPPGGTVSGVANPTPL